MNIKPLSDNILIEPIETKSKTEAGILLPDSADKDRPEQGKVVAVGPGKQKDGKRLEMDVKVGDTVLFSKYGPHELKFNGKQYLIAKQEDILGIIE
jgi:chaperonin GroES